jgi:hypothetical protein
VSARRIVEQFIAGCDRRALAVGAHKFKFRFRPSML